MAWIVFLGLLFWGAVRCSVVIWVFGYGLLSGVSELWFDVASDLVLFVLWIFLRGVWFWLEVCFLFGVLGAFFAVWFLLFLMRSLAVVFFLRVVRVCFSVILLVLVVVLWLVYFDFCYFWVGWWFFFSFLFCSMVVLVFCFCAVVFLLIVWVSLLASCFSIIGEAWRSLLFLCVCVLFGVCR